MQAAGGLRRYFYEYVYARAVERARHDTTAVIPISQARAMRDQIDQQVAQRGTTMDDPHLGLDVVMPAIDDVLALHVPTYPRQFGTPVTTDPWYQQLLHEFTQITAVASPQAGHLPISPYDPRWARRRAIQQAGTQLRYLDDESITTTTGGTVADLHNPTYGTMPVWRRNPDDSFTTAGRALLADDVTGLSALSGFMSQRTYDQVRDWVLDGIRDGRGRIDYTHATPAMAIDRCVAILRDLDAQGLPYTIVPDREPGQIKAVITDTGMEIRLIDTRNSNYAGARIYDNGIVTRYTTTKRTGTGVVIPSPAPDQAVRLLHYAQGQSILRLDDPTRTVGEVNSDLGEHPDVYHVDGSRDFMATVGQYTPATATNPATRVMIRQDATARTLPQFFATREKADQYGHQAVTSARTNFMAALDVEGLIRAFDSQIADGRNLHEITPPELSARPDIASIQRTYWDILTGAREDLVRPGVTTQMYHDRLDQIQQSGGERDMRNLVYSGTPAEKIRAHAEDVTTELIGQWEPEVRDVNGQWINQRFHPGRVAAYMTSETGQWRNLDNLAEAARECGITPSEILGDDFQTQRFADRLITFDPATAIPVSDHPSAFIRHIGDTIRDSITSHGAAHIDSINIDQRGVIRWKASKTLRNGSTVPITGDIGQVWDRGGHGEIITQFASGHNSLIIPGYEARIVAPDPNGKWTPVENRTRLHGYEQVMTDAVRRQIAADILASRTRVGDTTSLNHVYSHLYGTRHPIDYLTRATTVHVDPVTGEITDMLDPWTEAIVNTEARRVRYATSVHDESSTYAEYYASTHTSDPANDNHRDTWQLTGRNIAILTGTDTHGVDAPPGFFDPVMTGNQKNQGVVRYLTTDARVNTDGTITPGDPTTMTGTRTPLMTMPQLATMKYDPWDRQQMTASTIMQSAQITPPVGTALMTFGGWNTEDGIVVSSNFADTHQIRGVDGNLRPLIVGDKLSDLHGNKGTVTMIVDRDMNPSDARDQGIEQAVAWFAANPDMDVVMSPFSLISRRNAGSARELMDSPVTDLHHPTTTDTISSALGRMQFAVTHLAVDEKTKIYDDDQVQMGQGRNASSQLAWALHSHNCPAIMREFYGPNNGAEADMREYLRVTGIDMHANGTLELIGTTEWVDTQTDRRILSLPDDATIHTSTGRLNTAATKRAIGELIGDKGGDMLVPFPLTYPTGKQTTPGENNTWKLPVLSSHLRSGQLFDDGTSTTHDYTHYYQTIGVEACRYRDAIGQMDDPTLTDAQRLALTTTMETSQRAAHRAFTALTNDITTRFLTGKNNIVKTGIMSSRLPNSATMVWTGDPRLDIDQIGISPTSAAQLGLRDGDYALVWRDPILREEGVKYLRVHLDDRLTGASINPVLAASFDGDFDGDSVAVVKLNSKAAHAEALTTLTVEAHLVDYGTGEPALITNTGLDTQVAISRHPELRDEFSTVQEHAREYVMTDVAVTGERDHQQITRLSDFYRRSQGTEYGTALSFADPHTHCDSIRTVCVETGAKGNPTKLAAYARNLGGEDGVSGLTRADHEASMFATAVKTDATGLGGKFAQRSVRALRDRALKPVLELTYPVTQSILQIKHDAGEARHKYHMLHGPGRELWRGRLLDSDTGWATVYADGQPVSATRDQWVDQFVSFYQSRDGFNVPINRTYVEQVADALTDPTTGLIRNLDDDPTLRGSTLDRLAYDATFDTWVQAATNRGGLFDDGLSAQFACAATRRLRNVDIHATTDHTPSPKTSEPTPIPVGGMKSDVRADGPARGSRARSPYAVGVTPRYTITTLTPATADSGLSL